MRVVGWPFPLKCNFQQEHIGIPSNHTNLLPKHSLGNRNQGGFRDVSCVCACESVLMCGFVCTRLQMRFRLFECVSVCAALACLLYYSPSGCVLSASVVWRGIIRSVSGNRVCVCCMADGHHSSPRSQFTLIEAPLKHKPGQ